jgi:DNA-binding protein YbaB
MFDKMKDLYNLQKQAKEMQRQMEQERVTGTSRDGTVQLTLNGSYDLINAEVTQTLEAPQAATNIKEAYNDASDKLKKVLASKFQGMM